MNFLTLAALLSTASATLLLQIGTQADSTAIYDAIDTIGNLSIIPRDRVDMRAIDGAIQISAFSIGVDSRFMHYSDQDDDYRYSANIEKPADAGTVFLMSHLMTGDPIPLMTVIDTKYQGFTIYTLRNLTVDSANVDIYEGRYGGGSRSGSYVRFFFDSVDAVDGSKDHVGNTHTFTKPVREPSHKKQRPEPAGYHYKDLELVGGVQETLAAEVVIDDLLID